MNRRLLTTLFMGAALAAGARCFAEPPAAGPAADADAFAAVAKDIEQTVLALGYPKATADDLLRLVRDWNCEQWKQKLAQARAGSASGETAELAGLEDEAAISLYHKIERTITVCDEKENLRYFYLSEVVKHKKAQCLAYTQLFYILGTSIGLTVQPVHVVELASGSPAAGKSHSACLVNRSDGTVTIVDPALHFVSRPFVFKEEYVEDGNYWQLKRPDNRLKIFRRLQLSTEQALVAEIYDNLAVAYASAGQPDAAVSYCTKAIELNPKLAEAFANRGTSRASQGQFPEAISDYTKAIELNPKYADALFDRGVVYERTNQPAEAIADFGKAIECNRKYADAYFNRGEVYASQGQHQQAIWDFTRAIELNPTNAEAYSKRALAGASLGKMDNAKRDLQRALGLKPALKEQVKSISDRFNLGL